MLTGKCMPLFAFLYVKGSQNMITFYKPCSVGQVDENSTCPNWNLGCPLGKYNITLTSPIGSFTCPGQ